MYSYATLTQIEDQIEPNPENTLTTANSEKTMTYARRATRYIERVTTLRFIPEKRTRFYPIYPNDYINWRYNTLRLYENLLEVDTVTIGDETIPSNQYELYPRNSRYPVKEIYLFREYGSWFQGASDDNIIVTGIEGYRTNYDNEGWVNSLDTVQDVVGLDATVTAITVNDVDGLDRFYKEPRFDIGQVIRIDSEYMIVTDTDASTNTLTVIRGQGGTSAATHDNGAMIYTWNVEPEIVRACMLITSFNINNIGNMTRVTFDGVTTTERLEIPNEANDILNMFRPKNRLRAF